MMTTPTLKRKGPHTLAYHPTKGYRRVSDRRVRARFLMDTIFYIASVRANGRRNLRAAHG